MNLSQDEINALLGGTQSNDTEESVADDDILSTFTEENNADGQSADDILAGFQAEPEAGGSISDDLDDLFSRISEDPLPVADDDDDWSPPEAKEGMLTPDEVDILGEVGNISMGAVATAMYTLLDRRVDITTPRVSVYSSRDVLSLYRVPFVVVTVEFVEGITGNNLLVLKVPDAALITDLLMGGEGIIEEPVELNEMHLSAISEIMNQMMGASATSLSKLLHMPINISPPRSANVDYEKDVGEMLDDSDLVVKISFDMEIEGLLKSELLQLVPYELGRELAKRFMEVGMGAPSGDSAKVNATPPPAPTAAPTPPPAPAQEQPYPEQPYPQQPYPEQPYPQQPYPQQPYPQQPYPQQPYPEQQYPQQQYPPQPYPQQPYPQQPYPQQPYPQQPYPQQPYPPQYQQPYATAQRGLVDVHQMQFQSFDTSPSGAGAQSGIGLVYDIPLQVTVELGKTRKEISEILEFNTGTIVVLDKIAGDPVEIVVNGKLIARGEVVVIDENYGVRITDIINN